MVERKMDGDNEAIEMEFERDLEGSNRRPGGGSKIFEKGGSDKHIHNWGRHAPSRDSNGVWGSADSPTTGIWGFAPAAFLLCVYI